MVFAFLPTALLYLCSGAGAALSIVMVLISPRSSVLPCSVLFLCSAAGILISYTLSDRLDRLSEEGFLTDFDRSYRAAVKRSHRCFGSYRIITLLNTAYYCCAYERLEEARSVLLKAKRLIEKNGSSTCRCAYLLLVLEYKKKTRDMKDIGKIISHTAESIGSARYVTRSGRKNAADALIYSAAELELYSRPASELSSVRRDTAEKLYRLSSERLARCDGRVSYKRLRIIYDHALACILTGRNDEAQRCLNALISSSAPFPLCLRARKYLADGDIRILLERTP